MDNTIPMNGKLFGRKKTITKFPRMIGKVLVKGVSKVSRHFGGDTEAMGKASMVMSHFSTTQRSGPTDGTPAMVTEIVNPLFEDDNPKLQEQTAKAVSILAAQLPAESCLGLLEYPRVLEGLVRLLFKTEESHVQEAAAMALISLAGEGDECQRKVAQYPEALFGIVGLLSQDRRAAALQHGASLLFVLGLLPENQKIIVDFPGALEGLVRVLLKKEMPVIQGRAALALSVLASQQETKDTIGDFPQALVGIMDLLHLDDMPDVQECAAAALANLVTAKTTPRILEFPSVLSCLILLGTSCEAAIAVIINLDFYGTKQATTEMAEQALARCRRLPDFRLLNYPTSV